MNNKEKDSLSPPSSSDIFLTFTLFSKNIEVRTHNTVLIAITPDGRDSGETYIIIKLRMVSPAFHSDIF